MNRYKVTVQIRICNHRGRIGGKSQKSGEQLFAGTNSLE